MNRLPCGMTSKTLPWIRNWAAYPFEVQEPDGPLFKFTLTVVKERLQGEMTAERDGVVRGRAKVDAAKAEQAK